MGATFVFTEAGVFTPEDVAKAYGLEVSQIEKFLQDWVDQRRPPVFKREFTPLKILYLNYYVLPLPRFQMVRKWGNRTRTLEGEEGREFYVSIAPPRSEVSE